MGRRGFGSDAGSRQGPPPGLFPINYSKTPQILYDVKMPQINEHGPQNEAAISSTKTFTKNEQQEYRDWVQTNLNK